MSKLLPIFAALTVAAATPALSQPGTAPGAPPPSGVPSSPPSPAPATPSAPVTRGATPDGAGSMTGMFYAIPAGATQWRASDIISQPVYNSANERIGEIEELIIDRDGRVWAAIIGVGGFLGIGERHVAINYNALQVTTENNTMRIMANMNRNQLQQAPAFQQPDTWRRR